MSDIEFGDSISKLLECSAMLVWMVCDKSVLKWEEECGQPQRDVLCPGLGIRGLVSVVSCRGATKRTVSSSLRRRAERSDCKLWQDRRSSKSSRVDLNARITRNCKRDDMGQSPRSKKATRRRGHLMQARSP